MTGKSICVTCVLIIAVHQTQALHIISGSSRLLATQERMGGREAGLSAIQAPISRAGNDDRYTPSTVYGAREDAPRQARRLRKAGWELCDLRSSIWRAPRLHRGV